jgi:hypothetical protein
MPLLSPPWYTFWNKVNSALGNDPDISVGQLDTSSNPYVIKVTVSDQNKANALATIVQRNQVFGNVGVQVQILYQGQQAVPIAIGSAQQLAKVVQTALGGNGWFVEVQSRGLTPGSKQEVVFPIFQKAVIQFFNDDLSDYYSNFNGVVDSVFANVLSGAVAGIPVYNSTAKS